MQFLIWESNGIFLPSRNAILRMQYEKYCILVSHSHCRYFYLLTITQAGVYEHFLPPDTHTYMCVSVGEKRSFFGKFGVLCFLETPVLRFALLSYYEQDDQYP